MNGAATVTTAMTARIFGTKVRVTSCTWVRAWKRAMTMPTAIAAMTGGPEAMITVQRALRTTSRASASFISGDRQSRRDRQGLAIVEQRRNPAFRKGDGDHLAADRAVCRRQCVADEAVRLIESGCLDELIELGVCLH